MAIAIKSIPTLKGDEARAFNEKAKKAYTQKGSINFSRQKDIAKRVLKKAKL